jgi:hypothetical protein
MSNSEIVKAAYAALEAGDIQTYADFFSDDFLWVGSFPKPLNKKNSLTLIAALRGGLPDLLLNLYVVAEVGENTVRGTIAPTATHTAPLVLPGVTPLPPTGRSIAATRQLIEFTLVNGKITRIEDGEAEGGELLKILESLGLELYDVPFEAIFPG